jgi:putative Holliday junction resolvase
MVGRSMALDVGDVRIGVALSDPLGMIAQPHSVITCVTLQDDTAAVAALASEVEAVRIVVGLPLDQNGEPGPQAEKVLAFIAALEGETEATILTQDERYTTAFAERALIDANVRRKKRKGLRDQIAAQQILQTWLDRDAVERRNSGA